uniref:Uncharacterized protein n=1 Tax=Ditylenchus dipsaci TaxID=166011 RepID=A0A915CUR9_9BILA
MQPLFLLLKAKELEAAKLQAQQQQEQALKQSKPVKGHLLKPPPKCWNYLGEKQELEKSFPSTSSTHFSPSSSQGVRASPVEQTKSSAAAVTLSTPPAVRANRARQKAFQPSSAMLEMFAGGASEEKLDDARKPVTKKKYRVYHNCTLELQQAGSLISEPGPEHFSEDTKASSSSSYSSEELSPTTIQQVEHLKGAVHSPPN